MKKLWVIALKDIRTRFTDRRLLLIMLVAPLAISTIEGLAFGGLGRTSSPIRHIPVAVINNDQPDVSRTSFGALVTMLLTEGRLSADARAALAACPQNAAAASADSSEAVITLSGLIKGTLFDGAVVKQLTRDKKIRLPIAASGNSDYLRSAAKAAVDKGIYSAVVIIPVDFSRALDTLADPRRPRVSAALSVYGNSGDNLSARIVRSVVETIIAQMVGGNVAIGATMSEMGKRQLTTPAGASAFDPGHLFVCAFASGNDLIQLADQPVQGAPTSVAGALLVSFGSAMALFFALFTGQNGILSMYEERRNWTLQRILVSPTPRWAVLGGKLVAVFASVLFQLLVLVVALTLVGSLIEGHLVFIWGADLAQLGLLLLAVSCAVSGLGMLLAGVLKGIEQANVIGSVLNIALGILGGAFGFMLPRSVAQFSFIYWARNAFDLLAAGRGHIALNVLVLFGEGAVMFLIGLLLFTRKFEA